MDECEGLFSDRNTSDDSSTGKILHEFLIEMDDERNKNILMLGATNKPSRIDGATRRRFDSGHFHIPLPNEEARESLIKYKIENNDGRRNDLGPDDINYFVRRTENHSMSDITAIVNNLNKVITDEIPDAMIKSTRIDPTSLRPITRKDLDKVLSSYSSKVNMEDVHLCNQYQGDK